MASSSIHRTFGIPEILEMILLDLDMRTLLYIQRTCRSWLSMIRDSPAIQKALYFTAIENTPGQEKVQNPLLVDAFPALFKLTDPNNPEDGYKSDEPALATFDMMKNPSKLAAYLRSEASWRRMLVTQPPLRNFAFCTYATGGWGIGRGLFEIPEDPTGLADGLRMGDFFEALVFDTDVDYARCRRKRVIWWKQIPQDGEYFWNVSEELVVKSVDSDIVVSLPYLRSQRHEADDDEKPGDERAMDRIKATYKEFGIQPSRLRKTVEWIEWSHPVWQDLLRRSVLG